MKKAVRSLVTVVLLTLLVLLLTGFSPFQQDLLAGSDEFVVYGTPWVLVIAVVLGAVRHWVRPGDEVIQLLAAGLAVIGYLLVTNLPALEQLWPLMPVVVPQILQCILLAGAVMGFVPGQTASKVVRAFSGR